jgi:4'-phosphopantetheinyl transferase EntD
LQGLGVDLETAESLDGESILRVACRSDEILPLHLFQCDSLASGKVILVIKAAVYKLYIKSIGRVLDLHDVSIFINGKQTRVSVTLRNKASNKAGTPAFASGAFIGANGSVVAFASI